MPPHDHSRITGASALNTLIYGGQESASPYTFSGVRVVSARGKHNESGQIGIFSAQSVGYPRTDTWSSEARAACMHEQLSGSVVELVGMHCFQESEFIGC